MSSPASNIAMKDEATTALVPKLRFPEFRGTDGWETVPLSDLVKSLVAGVSVNSGDRPATEKEIGILKTSSVTNGVFESHKNKVVFDESEKKRVKEAVQADTIIISRMNTPTLVGANAYVEENLLNIFLPDRLWAAKPKPGVAMRFIASILGSSTSRSALSKLAKGSSGSMKNICKADVLAFRIQTPALAEQQKIAACLSSVEELIAAQARKVEALKTHKRGLMQQLFPREGETEPRLRFPEFQNAGEWKVKPLGKLVELQSGFAFSSSSFGSKGSKLVTPKNFTKYGHGNFDETVSKYTTEEVPERFICSPGDLLVLLTDLTATCELLGKPLLLEDKDGIVLLNQRVARVEPCASKLEALFLKYVFLSESYSDRIVKTATGSTVKHSSNKVLQEIPLFHPALPEQQRIASCLNSLDALITAETSKHEALKTHKKGLMQLLFPSPQEDEP